MHRSLSFASALPPSSLFSRWVQNGLTTCVKTSKMPRAASLAEPCFDETAIEPYLPDCRHSALAPRSCRKFKFLAVAEGDDREI